MNTSTPPVWRAANGYIYVQLASGRFHVIRPDGGTEERFTLPASAVALVPADSSIWDAA